MQELSLISERVFRARANQQAFCRSARTYVRKCVRLAILMITPLLGATLTIFPSPPEPVSPPSSAVSSDVASRAPSIVALMSRNGVTADFVRANLQAINAAEALPQSTGTLRETWLDAFYGDKQRLREFIEHTAAASGLPIGFFLRLLQQESGLNHRAVSRAGAQGVAQFMPATAAERGLIDPFDPFEAIPKAAEFLREQRAALGSLGLAAAAYNAGPQRVRNWLAGRSSLPLETTAYVAKITGRSADEWRRGGEVLAIAEPASRNGW
jgi:soluble lytic murein transglycosylase-like protein